MKVASTSATKDAGIFVFESQPLSQPRAAYKKSYTNQNCLAVSASHVFAAQADKAVVNVYSREKGSLEATVPFQERISSIALACEDTVLVVGTTEGRLFLWEVSGLHYDMKRNQRRDWHADTICDRHIQDVSSQRRKHIYNQSRPSLSTHPPTSSSQAAQTAAFTSGPLHHCYHSPTKTHTRRYTPSQATAQPSHHS